MASSQQKITYVRPWLYDKQLAAIFNDSRYAIIEASTKTGKTTGCSVWLTEQAMMGRPGHNFWWVAPIYQQAEIVFRRLKRGLPQGMYEANEGKLTITLPNHAVMWFKGADKPDSLYGEDVYAAVVDEASRCKDEAWHAIRSTLTATQGPIRIIGNVKGRKNWFYAMARRAESGEPNMKFHRLTAYDAADAGILSREEIEDAKRQLPENVFRELYLALPSDDGGNPFGISAIQACIGPLSEKPTETWGIDLAKSVDWTVLIGLDEDMRCSAIHRFQAPWQDTIRRIHEIVGSTRSLVDSTGVGDPVLEALQDGHGNFEGFKFSSTSKQQLMEGLAVAIQQQDLTIPEGVLVSELEQFEYAYTRTGVSYSAPAGQHDDTVCALALAVKHHQEPLSMRDGAMLGARMTAAGEGYLGGVSGV